MKVLIVLSIVALAKAQTSDYCAKSLCPGQGKHIACKNNGAFLSACPADAKLVDLSPHIDLILNSHNEKRNQIAGGKLSNFSPAIRMASMQWDPELAAIAEYNVKQCVMRHDQCRSTSNFKYAGQNLGIFSYSGNINGFSDANLISRNIDSWWSEYKYATKAHLAKYPVNYSGQAIGHFTVMAADKNVRTGCAATRYRKNGFNNFLIACNYATTNMINQAIYVGGTTASSCKTGRHPTYTNLCSTAETY